MPTFLPTSEVKAALEKVRAESLAEGIRRGKEEESGLYAKAIQLLSLTRGLAGVVPMEQPQYVPPQRYARAQDDYHPKFRDEMEEAGRLHELEGAPTPGLRTQEAHAVSDKLINEATETHGLHIPYSSLEGAHEKALDAADLGDEAGRRYWHRRARDLHHLLGQEMDRTNYQEGDRQRQAKELHERAGWSGPYSEVEKSYDMLNDDHRSAVAHAIGSHGGDVGAAANTATKHANDTTDPAWVTESSYRPKQVADTDVHNSHQHLADHHTLTAEKLNRVPMSYRPATREDIDAVAAGNGPHGFYKDGGYDRQGNLKKDHYRINGQMKTWKTRPGEFSIPVKYGMYGGGDHVTHINFHHFLVEDSRATDKLHEAINAHRVASYLHHEAARGDHVNREVKARPGFRPVLYAAEHPGVFYPLRPGVREDPSPVPAHEVHRRERVVTAHAMQLAGLPTGGGITSPPPKPGGENLHHHLFDHFQALARQSMEADTEIAARYRNATRGLTDTTFVPHQHVMAAAHILHEAVSRQLPNEKLETLAATINPAHTEQYVTEEVHDLADEQYHVPKTPRNRYSAGRARRDPSVVPLSRGGRKRVYDQPTATPPQQDTRTPLGLGKIDPDAPFHFKAIHPEDYHRHTLAHPDNPAVALLHADAYRDAGMPYHASVLEAHAAHAGTAVGLEHVADFHEMIDQDVPHEKNWHTAITSHPTDGQDVPWHQGTHDVFLSKPAKGGDGTVLRWEARGLPADYAHHLIRGLQDEAERRHGPGILGDHNTGILVRHLGRHRPGGEVPVPPEQKAVPEDEAQYAAWLAAREEGLGWEGKSIPPNPEHRTEAVMGLHHGIAHHAAEGNTGRAMDTFHVQSDALDDAGDDRTAALNRYVAHFGGPDETHYRDQLVAHHGGDVSAAAHAVSHQAHEYTQYGPPDESGVDTGDSSSRRALRHAVTAVEGRPGYSRQGAYHSENTASEHRDANLHHRQAATGWDHWWHDEDGGVPTREHVPPVEPEFARTLHTAAAAIHRHATVQRAQEAEAARTPRREARSYGTLLDTPAIEASPDYGVLVEVKAKKPSPDAPALSEDAHALSTRTYEDHPTGQEFGGEEVHHHDALHYANLGDGVSAGESHRQAAKLHFQHALAGDDSAYHQRAGEAHIAAAEANAPTPDKIRVLPKEVPSASFPEHHATIHQPDGAEVRVWRTPEHTIVTSDKPDNSAVRGWGSLDGRIGVMHSQHVVGHPPLDQIRRYAADYHEDSTDAGHFELNPAWQSTKPLTHGEFKYNADNGSGLPNLTWRGRKEVKSCNDDPRYDPCDTPDPAPYGYCPGCKEPLYASKHCQACGVVDKNPKYSWVGLPLAGTSLGDQLVDMGGQVADEDLGEDGKENEPHVTARYGLHTADAADVTPLLEGHGPVTIHPQSVGVFENEGKDDVLIVHVESPDLHALHQMLGTLHRTDTHAGYKPHATIAYVKAGTGKGYAEKLTGTLDKTPVVVGTAEFSGPDKVKTVIPLTHPE